MKAKARRRRLNASWLCSDGVLQATIGRYEGDEMVGSAYECTVVDYKLKTTETKRQRTECVTVSDAQQRLLDGQRVVVAGSDMGQLRSRLAAWGVEG